MLPAFGIPVNSFDDVLAAMQMNLKEQDFRNAENVNGSNEYVNESHRQLFGNLNALNDARPGWNMQLSLQQYANNNAVNSGRGPRRWIQGLRAAEAQGFAHQRNNNNSNNSNSNNNNSSNNNSSNNSNNNMSGGVGGGLAGIGAAMGGRNDEMSGENDMKAPDGKERNNDKLEISVSESVSMDQQSLDQSGMSGAVGSDLDLSMAHANTENASDNGDNDNDGENDREVSDPMLDID